MTRDELRRLVTTHLDRLGDSVRWSAQPGAVLYSGLTALRPGRFYLLGINPGGVSGPAIIENLCAAEGSNSYADERWDEKRSAKTILQHRVCDLIDALGVTPRELPSTNLAFAKSSELAKLASPRAWFRRCWPVHQALLREVRPAWIVMLGFGPAYDFLCARGHTTRAQQPIRASDAPVAWYRKLQFDLGDGHSLDTSILAVAHPSDRGFARAGLGTADRYPEVLKDFIARDVRADTSTTNR